MNRTRMRYRPTGWALALILGLAACAGGSGGAAGGGGGDLITQQQIDESGLDNALEVVRRYRPRWLQPTRGQAGSGARPVSGRPGMPQTGGDGTVAEVTPRVMVDGVPYGEIDSLSSLRSQSVASIQFVSAADARLRYGAGFEGGIIEVRRR